MDQYFNFDDNETGEFFASPDNDNADNNNNNNDPLETFPNNIMDTFWFEDEAKKQLFEKLKNELETFSYPTNEVLKQKYEKICLISKGPNELKKRIRAHSRWGELVKIAGSDKLDYKNHVLYFCEHMSIDYSDVISDRTTNNGTAPTAKRRKRVPEVHLAEATENAVLKQMIQTLNEQCLQLQQEVALLKMENQSIHRTIAELQGFKVSEVPNLSLKEGHKKKSSKQSMEKDDSVHSLFGLVTMECLKGDKAAESFQKSDIIQLRIRNNSKFDVLICIYFRREEYSDEIYSIELNEGHTITLKIPVSSIPMNLEEECGNFITGSVTALVTAKHERALTTLSQFVSLNMD